MGEAFIVRRGGGGSYKAYISVTGDAGAAVTAVLKATGKTMASGVIGSDGTVTLTVKQGGTYTVTAIDGQNTASGDVTVIESGQTYQVEVLFFNGVLYDSGVFTDKYAHSKKSSKCTITENTSNITIKSNTQANSYGYVYFEDVDITKFSTLTAYFSITTSDKNGVHLMLAESSNATVSNHDYVAIASGGTSGITPLQISLSDISAGNYCILFGFDTGGGTWSNSRNIVLTKLALT